LRLVQAEGDLAMSTPTTTRQDDLQSRLPDPARFFPEVAAIAGAMFKPGEPEERITLRRQGAVDAHPGDRPDLLIPVALIAKPIPGEASGSHYRK
jgi:hypothetical protein